MSVGKKKKNRKTLDYVTVVASQEICTVNWHFGVHKTKGRCVDIVILELKGTFSEHALMYSLRSSYFVWC